jgi:MFS family permease
VQRVGVQWLAWSLTGSYAWLAATVLAEAVAIMAFLPFFGTVVDRGDRLILARWAQFTLIILAALLATLTLLNLVTIWLLIVLMGVYGTAQAFWTPIRLSMAANLVPHDSLPSAIGIGAVLYGLAQFIGPAIAGLILATMGDHRDSIGYLFLLNSTTFCGYLAALFMISLHTQEQRKDKALNFLDDLMEGVRYCVHKEGLGLFMIYLLLVNILLRSHRELLAGLADGVYGAGVGGFAALQSAAGLGAIVGSALLTKFSRVEGLTHLLLGATMIGIIFQIAMIAAPTFWVGLGTVGFLAGFLSFYSIGSQVLVQSSIHSTVRGRVMSLWAMGTRGGSPMGAWAIGLAAEVWGLRSALSGATVIFLVVFLYMVPRRKKLADAMERPPGEDLPSTLANRNNES